MRSAASATDGPFFTPEIFGDRAMFPSHCVLNRAGGTLKKLLPQLMAENLIIGPREVVEAIDNARDLISVDKIRESRGELRRDDGLVVPADIAKDRDLANNTGGIGNAYHANLAVGVRSADMLFNLKG